MSEGHIKNATLKASGKGKEAKGTALKILDAVKLYLVRYLAHSPETHKSGTIGIFPVEDGDTNVPTPDGMPDLSDYKYHYKRAIIREGYVYLLKEQEVDKKERKIFYEYEVSDDGDFTMLQWEDPKKSNISWSSPKKSTTGDYILLKQSQDVKLWVAFSAFRWSEEYARSMFNDNDSSKREQRMQLVDCEQCFKGTFTQDSFKVGDEKLMFPSYFENTIKGYNPNSEIDFKKWSSPADQAKFDRKCEKIKTAQKENELDPTKGDFYFVVSDQLGIADGLCQDLEIERTRHEAIIRYLKTDENLDEAYQALVVVDKENPSKSRDLDSINSELAAMIDLATLIYPMKDQEAGIFKEYSKSIDIARIEQVLAVKQRREQRRRINNIRFALSKVLDSKAYQKVMSDFDTDKAEDNVNGKTMLAKYMIQMNLDPHYSDAYLDVNVQITPNAEIREVVKNIVSAESVTGNLLGREWSIDAVGSSIGMANKTATALDGILLAFNDMLKQDKTLTFSARIFKFGKNKDGNAYIKIPETEIPNSIRDKLDYTKVKLGTMEKKGLALMISLDSTNAPSGSNLKQLKNLNSLEVTLESLMPDWKKRIIGNNSRQWQSNVTSFLNNASFLRFTVGITFINTVLAISDLATKDDKYRAIINSVAASSELLYMAMKYEKVTKMVAKVSSKTTQAFVGKVAVGAGAALSFYDARTCFKNDEMAASGMYAVSGLTGFAVLFVGEAAIVVIPLIAISLAAGFTADYLRLTETERLLINSVFGVKHKFNISEGDPQQKLLVLAKAKVEKEEIKDKFKKYIADQRVVLNELAFLHRGIVGATATFYFNEGDAGRVYNQTIRKSSSIKHIEIQCRIGYMSFLRGEIDISLYYISDIGIYFEPIKFNQFRDIEANFEKGTLSICFQAENTFKENDGYLALVFRTYDTLDGQDIFAPQEIDGKKNYFILYFSSRGKNVNINPNNPNLEATYNANFKNGCMYETRTPEHVEIAEIIQTDYITKIRRS